MLPDPGDERLDLVPFAVQPPAILLIADVAIYEPAGCGELYPGVRPSPALGAPCPEWQSGRCPDDAGEA